MSDEYIPLIDRITSLVMMLIPLALLVFRSVRSVIVKSVSWMWRPISDQFARRDRVLEGIQQSVDAVRQQMSVVVGTLRLQADNAEDVGYFECDDQGRNTSVNRTYCRWMHCTPDQLMDWGFLGFIHPAQREAVRAEWMACIRDHRDYRTRFRMGSPDHGYREYDVIARPIPDSPPAIAWAGAIRLAHRRHDDIEAVPMPKDWRHDTGV